MCFSPSILLCCLTFSLSLSLFQIRQREGGPFPIPLHPTLIFVFSSTTKVRKGRKRDSLRSGSHIVFTFLILPTPVLAHARVPTCTAVRIIICWDWLFPSPYTAYASLCNHLKWQKVEKNILLLRFSPLSQSTNQPKTTWARGQSTCTDANGHVILNFGSSWGSPSFLFGFQRAPERERER